MVLAFGVGLSQWLLLTVSGVDRLFFTGTPEISLALIWITKLLSLLMIGFLWSFMAYAICRVREGDVYWARGSKIFAVYFSIQIFLLLIFWPGTWAWDDIAGYIHAQTYHLEPWQHIITSVLYICSAHILPFPGGYIIVESIIVALCVSASIVIAEKTLGLRRFKKSVVDVALKIAPFLMPPILIYQFGGYRIGILMYLELLVIVMAAAFLRQKKSKRLVMAFFAFLVALVAEWRSENIFYLLVGLISIFALTGNEIRERLITGLLCLCIFSGIHYAQKRVMNGGYHYTVMSTMLSAVELMKHADAVRDQKAIQKMAPIISPELVKENPNADGNLIWGLGKIYEINITKEMYNRYMSGLMQLALRYPQILLQERMAMFTGAIGLKGPTVQVSSVSYTVHLTDEDHPNEWFEYLRQTNWTGVRPLFPEIRKQFIYWLGQQNPDGTPKPLFYLFWNGIIPLAFLALAFLMGIMRKHWLLSGIVGFFLLKTCIVILAEPGTLFMYYLPQYMAGYVLFFWGTVMVLTKDRKKKG